MLMSRLLEKAMRTEWRTPHDLCTFLELTPTPAQRELFDRFIAGKTDFGNDDESIRGLCVCLLWETLSNPGKMTVVIGQERERNWVMQFITGLLYRNQTLVEVVGVTRWSLTFGSDPGWMIRAAHENPGSIQGLPKGSTVALLAAAEDWAIPIEGAARAAQARIVRTF